MVGVGSALAIRGVIGASFHEPNYRHHELCPLWGVMSKFGIDSLLFIPGVLGNLDSFLFFPGGRKAPLKVGASIGKWVMMIAFGASFGNTVMARIAPSWWAGFTTCWENGWRYYSVWPKARFGGPLSRRWQHMPEQPR